MPLRGMRPENPGPRKPWTDALAGSACGADTCAVGALRSRRGAKPTDRVGGGVQQSSGREKENLPPEANISPSAGRARSDTTDNEDSDVVAMWERSVRDIFAALADEEGTHTFGFSVTTAKNPRDGELPAIALPPAPGVAPARSAVPGKFVAAGGIHPVEPAFRLSAVNGQQVSGRTAQEIKDMVSAGRLLLRLELICSQRKECQRRTVWCR